MTENPSNVAGPGKNEQPLESWKEIATYLKRTERTVKRWEKEEGLPVRRHMHLSRASVYAYPSELDAWVASRQPQDASEVVALPPGSRWRSIAALAAVLLLTLISAGSRAVPAQASNGEGGSDVVARRISGTGVDFSGSPSPDGRYLSFVDWSTGDLAVRDVAAGANRRLTNKGTWSQSDEYAEVSRISPDGRWIAYAWFNEEFYELRLVGMDGAQPQVLYKNAQTRYLQPSAWSPDGRFVYCVFRGPDRTHQIVRVGVEDGSRQVLKSVDWRWPGHLSPSPDGRYLAYDFPPQEESPFRDVFLLATDGSREVTLVRHAANDFLLGWSPKGNEIVFGSDRTGENSAWVLSVGDGQPNGNPRLVRHNLGNIHPIGMNAAGSLYYGVDGGSDVYLGELDPVTSGFVAEPHNAAERFWGSNFGADFSPDGEWLAFVSQRGHGSTSVNVLVVRSLRTGQERELPLKIRVHRVLGQPRWSPDSKALLVSGSDLKGRRDVFRVDPQTGDVQPFQVGGMGRWPEWAADGQSAVFVINRDSSDPGDPNPPKLVRFHPATRKFTSLHSSRHIHAWTISPDRKQIAVASTSPDQAEGVGMSNLLLIIPSDGGETRELLRLPNDREFKALVWTPDGDSLLFQEGGEDESSWGSVQRISLQGGQPSPLNLANLRLRGFRFHPDGKRLAYTLDKEQDSEVWVLENFLPQQKAAR